jgi:hypothetical protein
MQTKVESILKLAERVIEHLDSISFRGLIGSKGTFWSPAVGSCVGSAGNDRLGDNAVTWAAGEKNQRDGWSHAGVVPSNGKRFADGWVGGSVWRGNWVVGKLSL